MSQQDELISYLKNELHITPDNTKSGFSNTLLFRSESGKAFARFKSHRKTPETSSFASGITSLSFRCDPLLSGSLQLQDGFSKAISDDWVTVTLDGSVSTEMLQTFLSIALELSSEGNQSAAPSKTRDWLIPANPKYFDLFAAFHAQDTILWKQSSKISVGDIVYLYVAAPYSAIMFRCCAVEVDIPYTKKNSKRNITTAMRIKLLHTYDQETFSLNILKEYGVTTVRGPRSVPASLKHQLEIETVT